jgi:prolyl 4-hydroxylase
MDMMPEFHWISDDIFTVTAFLDSEDCQSFIRASESSGFHEAPIDSFFGPTMAKEARNNSRAIRDDLELAQRFWRRSAPYIPATLGGHRAVGINERFRFYRYDPGQTFRWHRDGFFERANGERSRLTFMVYLNDDFEGGETNFERVAIRPATGMALFFVHHLLHEGAVVTRGHKYVLRTDVMYSG